MSELEKTPLEIERDRLFYEIGPEFNVPKYILEEWFSRWLGKHVQEHHDVERVLVANLAAEKARADKFETMFNRYRELQQNCDVIEAWRKEVDKLQSENADLQWFVDQINSRVIPGETDTHDAARDFINGTLRNYRAMEAEYVALKCLEEAAVSYDCKCPTDHAIPKYFDQYAREMLKALDEMDKK